MTEPLTNEEELADEAEDATSEEPEEESEGAPEASDETAPADSIAPPRDDPRDAAPADSDAPPRDHGGGDGSDDPAERGRGGSAAKPKDPSADLDRTELAALREEFEDLNDRHLRLVAEFNNFRRRSEQERLSAWARAQADLVASLLDVLDDIQRVADLDLSNATVDGIMEGIDLVERKFMRQLTEAGVEVIDPHGEPFDPERMEAMMRVPPDDDDQVDTVAQVFQKGYSLKGHLVRPARVSVYTAG